MYGMRSGTGPTYMLAVLKFVKTLISANVHEMHSTSVIDQFLKRTVVIMHTKTKFLHDSYALAYVYINVCCRIHA